LKARLLILLGNAIASNLEDSGDGHLGGKEYTSSCAIDFKEYIYVN